MRYEKEFKASKNKVVFIKKLLKKYDVSKATADRRYYDLRKQFNRPEVRLIQSVEVVVDKVGKLPCVTSEKPGMFKMLLFEDLKRFIKYDIINEMKRQGFTMGEIKWLKENKMI